MLSAPFTAPRSAHPGNLRVVGNHHNGLVKFLAGHFQETDHIIAGLGIQVAGGFICQNDRGLGGQSTGNRHPLLLAAGEVIGQTVQFLLQPQQLHDPHDELFVRLAAIQGDGENNVFPHAEHRHQIVVLEDKADLLAAEDGGLLAVQLGKLSIAHPDAALGGGVQAAQHIQQG